MKALKRIQSFTILGLFLVFTSCSLLTGKDGANTRVTLRIGSDLYHRLSSRAAEITDSEEGGGFEIDVEIKGDYSDKKSATISENGAQIIFSDIPEGAKIYAEGKIFKDAYGRKIMLYNGKSEEITIEEGDGNFLELLLKKQADFLVAFDTDGGTEVDNQLLFSGESALEPESAPTKDGYTFLGWFADASDKDFFDFSTPIVEDTLLFAKWVKNENVFTPTSNTQFYDYSLSASDTYLLRLNGYNFSHTSYGAALKGCIENSNISATLYVDIVGTNKSTGDNHGGFKFEPKPNSISDSSVDVIFFTSSTGSFEVGRRDSGGKNYQMDYPQKGLTATYSFMNNCTVSSMKFGETECSTAEEFFTNAKSVNSGPSKHSYFEISKN